MISSSSNHHNIPVPLNLNAKELMAKMAGAASFSPQMLEAYMKLVSGPTMVVFEDCVGLDKVNFIFFAA